MPDRETLAGVFLARTAFADWVRRPLAGDASNRRYERLANPKTGETVVLMDAPPERGEDIRPFTNIAKHLRGIDLSAPAILAEARTEGFLVLEDLGDALFARVLSSEPDKETALYQAATDVLVALHRAPLPKVVSYDADQMANLAGLAFTKYRAGILGDPDAAAQAEFQIAFARILNDVWPTDPVLVLRDYHAENLLWLPDRRGVARVGLLDFQDAMSGHPAYDLVSLLQDARRDVSVETENAMIARYLEQTGYPERAFRVAYAVLGAQRNLRILGVFARLGAEMGKPHYVDLIPRVWAHLMRDLEHPALAHVANLLKTSLPPPSTEALPKLKSA
jgi:aminoglycoside/choline kinase family phosphotransferase